MHKNKKSGRIARPQLNAFRRFMEAEVNCYIAFARLMTNDRQKVVSVLDYLAQRHADHAVGSCGWDPRAEEDLRIAYLQLREIEKGMAAAWRQWASALLEAHPSQFDCRVAILGLLKQFRYCLGLVEGVGLLPK